VNRLEVVAVTHRGLVREHNEDTVAVTGFLSTAREGEPTRFPVATARPVTCVVADGLGGHAEGQRASRVTASVIADAGPGLHDDDAVVRVVEAAHAAVEAEASWCSRWSGMATTVVLLTVAGTQATCANVGDSRCYLYRDGVLVQLSLDDSPLPVGATPPVGRTTVVIRTVGGYTGAAPARPHIHRTTVEAGDRFLLCSDGLTDLVPADLIEDRLKTEPDGVEAVRALLRAALDAGGDDNVSMLLVTIPERVA